ncbi:NADPH-dependent FMN reductase [Mesorhizobium loti]|uniref:FMN reductase (NADPH) n=1 Tax=Mesorhizobium loti R88b TaxID=935548 RepID=A0A6M7WHP6_RHILI|nr:NADPH-dependent FMN reductase [Mesorhizobium loti]QKD03500.1 FMN reductase (NADPH) [Mesorhizobium loti R88b]
MAKVLIVSGSPSKTSRTAALADAIANEIRLNEIETEHLRIGELDPRALLSADFSHPSLVEFAAKVKDAHGIIVATPIYKASFSGLLKAALDILPQYALAGKVVLPLGTGGSLAHMLALDYALRPVLQSMKARHIVQSHFVLDTLLSADIGGINLKDPNLVDLRRAWDHFMHSLTEDLDRPGVKYSRAALSVEHTKQALAAQN